jgi:hypothetical protein
MNDTALNSLCERLMRTGWKLNELDQLCEFLRAYSPSDEDRSEAETRHLEFLRFLVQTGRIVS